MIARAIKVNTVNIGHSDTLGTGKKEVSLWPVSLWTMLTALVKIQTPPKPVMAVLKSLTEDQKIALMGLPYMGTHDGVDDEDKEYAVSEVVRENLDKLSKANQKKQMDWEEKVHDACQTNALWHWIKPSDEDNH
uniref:Uncharacterized protein n=1 Tax=Plectus sambesii TaxID=2011161 RepID=A0A914WM80_9BILA